MKKIEKLTSVEGKKIKPLMRELADIKFNGETDIVMALLAITAIVDPVIKEVLGTYLDNRSKEAAIYQVSSGGKRIRPALAIISCLSLNGKVEDVIYPAAGLEILHNTSLIVDDIIDHSMLRRGLATEWAKYGRSLAECMALAYSSAIFQAAIRSREPILLTELFAKTMKVLVDGELLDILFEQHSRKDEPFVVKNRYSVVTNKDYIEMVGKKTSALLEACCETGAICAKASKKQIAALKSYGYNFGIAFQIQDDILDIFGEQGQFGKKIGKDIEERKLGNCVMSFAFNELSAENKNSVFAILQKEVINDEDIHNIVNVIAETSGRKKACDLAKLFADNAKKELKNLPKNKWTKLLEEFVDFVIERKM